MREASASVSSALTAGKTSSIRSTAIVAGAALPARGIAGRLAGTIAKPSASRSSVIARVRRSGTGRVSASASRRSMTTRTPSSSAHCRDSDSKTSGRLRATTSTSSIVPILSQPLAAPRELVEELHHLGVDLLDVGRPEAPGRHVAGDLVRIDRHRADVADVARRLQGLPLGIQQVFDARHDEGPGLDGAQRSDIVSVHPGRGADVVALVGPGLIDVVVRIEGVEARVFLGSQPWQHVEGPRKLLAIPLGAPRGGEADDVAPEAHAPRRHARVVAVV